MEELSLRHNIFKKYVLIVLLAIISLQIPIFAAPSQSYTYDSYGKSVASPPVYEVSDVVNGINIGCDSLKKPNDMFVDKNGSIYILDTGNNRVIITKNNFKIEKIISSFNIDGKESPLNEPKGIYVDSKANIYVADTGNNRVVLIDKEGNIKKQLLKPNSSAYDQEKDFLPVKVVADRSDNTYIISTGINEGIMVFDSEAKFQGFYGSNKVVQTTEVLTDFFWKQIMSKEQKEQLGRQVPPELRALDISEDDFIFSLTNMNLSVWADYKDEADKIRKLNPKGKDILVNKMPEYAQAAFEKDSKNLNYADTNYDENGFVNIIDNLKGRILQFDSDMNLVIAFGTLGDYKGAFKNPSAIESYKEQLYVLDSSKCNITIFKLTDFGEKVHTAIIVYSEGNYNAAITPWNEVLKLNTNYEADYIGIGNAYLSQQEYLKAMEYFKIGRDSKKYNDAFKLYRISVIRKYFAFFVLGILIFALFIVWIVKRKKTLTANKDRM